MIFKLRTNFNFVSGYAKILDTILQEIEKYDVKLQCIPLGSVDTKYLKYFNDTTNYNNTHLELLMIPPPNNFDMVHPIFRLFTIKNRVIFTMWESTMVDFSFIEELNKTKCVIVPNEWNKTNFINQGVVVPIEVLNLFFDVKLPSNIIKSNNFVFGTANGDVRKQLNKVAKCFLKAFPNNKDVNIRIKTDIYNKRVQYMDNRIISDHGHFTDNILSDWYHSLDVFVSGATSEGWGMMQGEAMSCGVPIIANQYAGLNEFFDKEIGYPLKYDEVSSTDYWKVPGGKWSQFYESDMVDTMIHCYNNRDEVREMGLKAKEKMKQYTVDNFMTKLVSILKKYS